MTAAVLEQKIEKKIFTVGELASIDRSRFPKHVAIMMDGNRRWARKRGMPKTAGHWRGAEALVRIVRAAHELNIEVLTVYALSTENMNRSPLEVRALMRVFKAHLVRQRNLMIEHGVRLGVIGDVSKLPEDVQLILNETIAATKDGRELDLVLAINYGARDEIRRAVCKIVDDCLEKKIVKESITEKDISEYLDTAKWKDPDLLIRTSGENRISNFLLWQISYSEVLVTDVLWPDFSERDLLTAILEYQQREMRRGR